MPRLKLTLEYEGTAYVGWQRQLNGLSVQEVVERALGELLGREVSTLAASRTDAGVHALGQVVAFTAPRTLPLTAYLRGLSALLPEDISVVAAVEVSEGFEPRRDSLGKRYRYLISNRPVRSPLRRRTHWELFAPLDVAAMDEAARPLVGSHDFSAFRASNCEARTTLRSLRELALVSSLDVVQFEVEGTAFLKHMVRNIVGSLVEVGRGRRPVSWVAEVLASRDRTQAGPTAPPQGLVLVEVRYPE
ncbi:MAG: tRNA pseudouridine(38-40) synthase TruA [Myxococcaceae bacterium]